MERIDWLPDGVCASSMTIWIDNGIIQKAEILDSCHGNSQGIMRLLEGRSAKEIATLLKGIKCEERETSCPDQLALALEKYLERHPE